MNEKKFTKETIELYYKDDYDRYVRELKTQKGTKLDDAIREAMYQAAGVGNVSNIDLNYIIQIANKI